MQTAHLLWSAVLASVAPTSGRHSGNMMVGRRSNIFTSTGGVEVEDEVTTISTEEEETTVTLTTITTTTTTTTVIVTTTSFATTSGVPSTTQLVTSTVIPDRRQHPVPGWGLAIIALGLAGAVAAASWICLVRHRRSRYSTVCCCVKLCSTGGSPWRGAPPCCGAAP